METKEKAAVDARTIAGALRGLLANDLRNSNRIPECCWEFVEAVGKAALTALVEERDEKSI